jgi:hypothetical protein
MRSAYPFCPVLSSAICNRDQNTNELRGLRLAKRLNKPHFIPMASPSQPVELTAEQVTELSQKLADMRHNVNNYLSLILAAGEVMRFRPESAARLLGGMPDHATKITEEIRHFSDDLEQTLGTRRTG